MDSSEQTSVQSWRAKRRYRGLRPFKPGQSGNPGGRASNSKRCRELFDAMLADFGGDLSAIDRAMLEQACHLMARAERVRDADVAVRLTNAGVRLLTSLRKARAAKREPERRPLAAYLDDGEASA